MMRATLLTSFSLCLAGITAAAVREGLMPALTEEGGGGQARGSLSSLGSRSSLPGDELKPLLADISDWIMTLNVGSNDISHGQF